MQIHIITTKKTVDVTQLVPTVKWAGDYQQAARSLDFSLLSSPTDKSIPVVDCPLGAGVRLMSGGKALFDGFIFSRTKATDASAITLSCFDRGFYLKRNKACYKFTAITPEAVAGKLAADFGLAVGEFAVTGVPIFRNFFNVSLYDILATVYTLAAKVTGKQYHVGFRGEKIFVTVKEKDKHTLVIAGKSNLIAASMSDSIEKAVNAVSIYDANENFVRSLADDAAIKLYGRMQEVVKQSKTDDKAAAAQRLLDEGGISQRITVDCLGNTANVTGGTVVVREPYTGVCGLFYIDSDTHEWKRGQYYNKLVLNFKNIMDEKEAGSLPNASGKDTADVGDVWEYKNK